MNQTIIKIVKFYKNYQIINDKKLFSNLLNEKNYNLIIKDINDSKCFYSMGYVLTWNYYFNKPTCSKYNYNFINMSIKSQNETIQNLKEKKPKIILYSTNNYSSNYNSFNSFIQYGVSSYSMNYLIHDFILNNYKPYLVLNDHWFWKISNKKFNFSSNNSVKKYTLEYSGALEKTFVQKTIYYSGLFNYTDMSNISDIKFRLSIENNSIKFIGSLVTTGKINKLVWAGLLKNYKDTDLYVPLNDLGLGKNEINVYLIDKNNVLYYVQTFNINLFNKRPFNYVVEL